MKRKTAMFSSSLPLILAALLTGCETSTLAYPPVAETACDARLAGDWLQAASTDPRERSASTQARIDARCRLVVTRRDGDGMHLIGPIDLHVGRDEAGALAWVDGGQIAANLDQGAPPMRPAPGDAEAADGDDAHAPAGRDAPPGDGGDDRQAPPIHDYIVLRYAIDDDRLRLYPIDADASAQRLLAASRPATITRHPTTADAASAMQTAIHVEGPLDPAQFRQMIVFAAQPAYEFRRNPREPRP